MIENDLDRKAWNLAMNRGKRLKEATLTIAELRIEIKAQQQQIDALLIENRLYRAALHRKARGIEIAESGAM